jgi:choline dehydrogenase-like flavoprotein
VARLRYFGGSTNHWEGWCRPLDEIDFETREYIAYSGWPFDKSHLDPFYERAQAICQLGPFAYDADAWKLDNSPPLPFIGDCVITTIYQFSPPTRFGEVYRDEITRAANITTFLYANVVDIETTETSQTVTRLRVACLDGNKFWVTAKLFILAAGGIENPRLLLLSNKVQSAGLGNQHDLVGRFFMEHPHLVSGLFLPSHRASSTDFYSRIQNTEKNVLVLGVLTLSTKTLRREQLTNFSVVLIQPWSWSQVSRGVTSFKRLLSELRRRSVPEHYVKHLKNVIVELDDVAIALYKGERPPATWLTLENRSEQVPDPGSRVTLTAERDRLGKNRVRLDWRLSPIDKRSIRRGHEIIGKELGRAGLGRLRVVVDDNDAVWDSTMIGGCHHMGTTRMHVNPQQGVVDANCQVHGMSNLFIAGSSVFPTSGYANPTLTIVALAIRLADHVKRIMT